MAANVVHFFRRNPPTYFPRFNNYFSRIACHPTHDNASKFAGVDIIRFLAHIKSVFEKILSEDVLNAWMARQRLAMLTTRGHKCSYIRHHCSRDAIGSWATHLQT